VADAEPIARAEGRGERRAIRISWLPWLTLAALIGAGLAGALAWALFTGPPGDDSPEAGFARDMSTHHEQAVEMALLVRDRTEDPRIKTLATDIALTQQGQIGQMQGWLGVWGLPAAGEEPAMAWMGHPTEGRMPGMASAEEIARLGELSGIEADREFLRLMIRHHEGGVPMAQAALERSDNEVVRRLAAAIVRSQQAEVELMQGLLEGKGGETSA
jgi:uncharacterized protein (DUF305 family)